MPPRKALPKGSKPTVVRRVVRKVTTEQVVEEFLQPTPPPRKSPAKSTNAVKKVTNNKNPTTPRVTKKPKLGKAPAKGKVDAKKESVASASRKAAAKARAPAAGKNTSVKTPTKSARKPVTKRQTAPKAAGKKQAAKSASLAVKPAIAKVRKAKSTPAKQGASSSKADSDDPLAFARIINGAMHTARQAAQEEMDALVSSTYGIPTYPTSGLHSTLRQPSAPRVGAASSPNPFSTACVGVSTGAPFRTKQTARKPVSRPRTAANPSAGASRMKRTARKSVSAQPSAAMTREPVLTYGHPLPPLPRSKHVKKTARKSTSTTTKSESASPRVGSSASDGPCVWEVTHETGFIPDGFHSYTEPTKRNLGTFTTRAAAVQRGKRAVGSVVGFSWEEVSDSGDFETVSDSGSLWEICWSPPDSEYSRVIARRISTAAGRWVVDVEHGYPADGWHSFQEQSKKQLGPYASRAVAVGIGKKQVGAVCGIGWDEVVEGGDLKVKVDSSQRWEVCWSPPDSEYSHVVARMVAAAESGEMAGSNIRSGSKRSDSDDDEGPYTLAF